MNEWNPGIFKKFHKNIFHKKIHPAFPRKGATDFKKLLLLAQTKQHDFVIS
jgi:hypothetical protein